MQITGFDHIVLSCHDVATTISFYRDVLGCRVGEERPGKWAIWFGDHKISVQDESDKPAMAVNTLPGTGNFCVHSATPVDEVAEELRAAGVEILTGPAEKAGAIGPIRSVYFRDPEDNLVEICNRL